MSDNQSVKLPFPFPVVSTNMPGVYTIPPLPRDFDLKTASNASLVRRGLFLPRPKADAHPRVAAAWDRIYERGLRVVTPRLEPLRHGVPREKKERIQKPRLPGTRTTNYVSPICGAGVTAPDPVYQSVTGAFGLPYLSVPPGGLAGLPPSQLAASVVLGQSYIIDQVLRTTISFSLNQTTNPPSTSFEASWEWSAISVTPAPPYASGSLANAPAMQPGDLVQLYAAYFTLSDGTGWGNIYYIFFNARYPISDPWLAGKLPPGYGQPTIEVPTLISHFMPAPQNAVLLAHGVAWVMEDVLLTPPPPTTTLPAFSSSPTAIAPVTFTNALGCEGLMTRVYLGGPTGFSDLPPWAGFPLPFPLGSSPPYAYPSDSSWTSNINVGGNNDLTSVTLGSESVSILYTG